MVLSLPAAPPQPAQSTAAEPGRRRARERRQRPRRDGTRRDPGPGRRRRAADPAGAARSTCGPAATRCVTAATGTRRARPRRRQHPPDLVILDLGLPDIDGVEVIRGLRGWTAVPIIVLSGRTDSADKVEALDAGADDYVTKPFGDRRAAGPDARRRRGARRPTTTSRS